MCVLMSRMTAWLICFKWLIEVVIKNKVPNNWTNSPIYLNLICILNITCILNIRVVNLSQNTVLKKIIKVMQAVKTSRWTNLHIVYLTTPKCLYSQKSKFSKRIGGCSKKSYFVRIVYMQCARSLHVCPFGHLDEMWIWRPKWEPKMISYSQKHFLGISQSDLFSKNIIINENTKTHLIWINQHCEGRQAPSLYPHQASRAYHSMPEIRQVYGNFTIQFSMCQHDISLFLSSVNRP